MRPTKAEFKSKTRSARPHGYRYITTVLRLLKEKSMKTSSNNKTLTAATLNDPRWAAVIARNSAADGKFFYSVKTTGVYCRPSCASRPAKPENVKFFATCADAERAGFRPCKRCKPGQPPLAEQHAATVAKVCRLIESAEAILSLAQLANHAGLSAYHFHRIFKSATGLTPKAYATAHRAKRIRSELGRGGTVTAAIFDAGYNSNGRFYEKSNAVLGMTPTKLKLGNCPKWTPTM